MPDFILQVLGVVTAGAGVYAAIRADLARITEKANNAAESASRAHARIDNLMERH